MGFYTDQILPRAIDCVCGVPELSALRASVANELSGVVVEIGFGSGEHLAFLTQVMALTNKARIECRLHEALGEAMA